MKLTFTVGHRLVPLKSGAALNGARSVVCYEFEAFGTRVLDDCAANSVVGARMGVGDVTWGWTAII